MAPVKDEERDSLPSLLSEEEDDRKRSGCGVATRKARSGRQVRAGSERSRGKEASREVRLLTCIDETHDGC